VIGLRKGGAGAITVTPESGAGYFVAGDDYGGTPATAAFEVTGFAWVEIRSNSDDNSAVFIVGGDTDLAKTAAGAVTFPDAVALEDAVTIGGALDVNAAADFSQPVTLSGSGRLVGQVETISGHIETVANKTYVLDLKAPYAYTVNQLAAKTASGTCTAKLTIDGVDVTGITALAVSSSEDFDDASGANSVAAGATLALVLSSNSSGLDLSFTVKVTRA
jgi:hypothetical protein